LQQEKEIFGTSGFFLLARMLAINGNLAYALFILHPFRVVVSLLTEEGVIII
jgi:hypothetical protein